MSSEQTADRVAVLMYHRIDRHAEPRDAAYCVTPNLFARHLDWLASNGYQPCSVGAFEQWYLHAAALPDRSILITFDDGFRGLHEYALPLLAARRWPATVFLVSGLIGASDIWASREFGVAGAHALLDRAQITEMAQCHFEFHSHSRTHPDLTALSDHELRDQLTGSREELQDLLGRPVDYLAFPFGRVDARVKEAARSAGYRLGFSVLAGFNQRAGDAFEVRRLDVTGRDSRARFGRKVALGSNDGSLGFQLRYVARRALARLGGNT